MRRSRLELLTSCTPSEVFAWERRVVNWRKHWFAARTLPAMR